MQLRSGGSVIRIITVLLASLVAGPVSAADQASEPAKLAAPCSPAAASPSLMASAARGVSRLVRTTPAAPGRIQAAQPQPEHQGWIGRHPRLFGALIGFGVGCVAGASRVGGSEDNFFNALDEFACPVVGGIGAAAGALVGAMIK